MLIEVSSLRGGTTWQSIIQDLDCFVPSSKRTSFGARNDKLSYIYCNLLCYWKIILQKIFNIIFYIFGRSCRSISMDWISLTIDEKFGEISFDSFSQYSIWGVVFEILEDRVSVWSIDMDLGWEWKGHTIAYLTRLFHLDIRYWFLSCKLIARKSYDHQSLIFVSLIEFL